MCVHVRYCLTRSLGDEGAKAVAQLLRSNFTIRTLLLDNNEITSIGGMALGRLFCGLSLFQVITASPIHVCVLLIFTFYFGGCNSLESLSYVLVQRMPFRITGR